MVARKRLIANRQNAQKSTGPKTEKGKAISKMNAVKHGLLAKDAVLPGEDCNQLETLRQGLVSELQPQGSLEAELVQQIAFYLWRLRRVMRVEVGIYNYHRLAVELEQAEEAATEAYRDSGVSLGGRKSISESTGEANAKVGEIEDRLRQHSTSLGALFVRDAKTVDAVSKLTRYEREIRTSLERALHELQRLQAARLAGHGPAPAAIDVTINGDLPLSDGP